jgi:hypothetical protein
MVNRAMLHLIKLWLEAAVEGADTTSIEGHAIETKVGPAAGSTLTPRTQRVTLADWDAVGPVRSGRATTGRGRRRNRNAVSDDDIVVAYQNLLDDKTHDPPTLHDVKRIGRAVQSAQKRR